jgi:hypothetical protein
MIHPDTEVRFIDAEKGHGLFAVRYIPRGTITWTRDPLDREFSSLELSTYPTEVQEMILHYSYRNKSGNFIFCWDNTRYINHSSWPNTCITPYDLELAICDIHPGDEITNHYGMLNIIEPFEPCGENREIIRPDDLVRHHVLWDGLLAEVFPLLTGLDQPLRKYIDPARWHHLEEISDGRSPLQSILSCYYREP